MGISDVVDLEFSAGLLFERLTRAANSGGSNEVVFILDSLSLLTAANLLVGLSPNLSLVGGISAISALTTTGKVSSGNFLYEDDFKVSGYTLQGQIGVAFSI